MDGQKFQKSVNNVLGIGILKESQHDAIDGLDEVVTFVFDVTRSQFLHNFHLMLVFVDQLRQGKAGPKAEQFAHGLDDMWAFNAILEKSDLVDQFFRRVFSACGDDVVHAAQDGSEDELCVHAELGDYLL